ncbi:MAG: DNA alkylation repair protein [Saprospiraceae bacterium]|nr:DNA alkylation repair protein [Saprospiraceae bacterium]
MFNRPLLVSAAGAIQAVRPDFQVPAFLGRVFDARWGALELKQRVRQIAQALRASLPPEYPEAVSVLVRTVEQYIAREGEKMTFEYTFLPDFVEAFGVEDPDHSLPALEVLTRWSSAEFAIRPFLLRYPERVQAQMLRWSRHESALVRRLSSEGFRPRLPWGMGVPALKKDPSPILPVLENLKNDPAETVRRSVANCLNDISKEHPALALELAQRWSGVSAETDWVVRHACRGLLKKGHAGALAQFGFEQGVAGVAVENLLADAAVRIGERFRFSCGVRNTGAVAQKIRLEYGIDYLTGSGKVSRKVFKIKEMHLPAGAAEPVERQQRFEDLTTRKHFPGPHRLRLLVNGAELAALDFEVK